jgi:hypothetical protein
VGCNENILIVALGSGVRWFHDFNIHDLVNNISALIHFLVLIAASLFEVFICHHLNYHR